MGPRVLRVGIEREGRSVLLAVRGPRGDGQHATLRTGTRAALAIATSYRAAAEADDDFSTEFQVEGDLETEPRK